MICDQYYSTVGFVRPNLVLLMKPKGHEEEKEFRERMGDYESLSCRWIQSTGSMENAMMDVMFYVSYEFPALKYLNSLKTKIQLLDLIAQNTL